MNLKNLFKACLNNPDFQMNVVFRVLGELERRLEVLEKQALYVKVDRAVPRNDVNPNIWVGQSGIPLYVKDMDDKHLRCAIEALLRLDRRYTINAQRMASLKGMILEQERRRIDREDMERSRKCAP